MTNAQLDAFLETLAKLVENKATTVEEAAELIRQAKTQPDDKKKRVAALAKVPLKKNTKRRAGSLTPATLILS